MSNEISNSNRSLPSFNVHAEGNGVAVGYTDSINTTMNIIIADGSKSSLSTDFFNLIIGFDPFSTNRLVIERKRVLKEYISDDVKEKFCDWTKETISEIKKLPTIIAQERDGTTEQQAVFAFIREIKTQDNGIKIYFQKYFPIPFSFLYENMWELAITHKCELTRTHWTIKGVNLLEVMQDAGLFPGK